MPKVLGYVPIDRWEREVLNQLRKQLPSDWVVLSGIAWTRRGPSDDFKYVRDGQADFVVLAPHLGLCVLEVKGSREFRVAEDGRWYRYGPGGQGVEIDEPPPDQARRNMFEAVDMVRARSPWPEFPGRYSFIVVYPQGALQAPLPTTIDPSTIVTKGQMHELQARIRKAIEERGHGDKAAAFDAAVVGTVSDILTSQPFRIIKADTSLEVKDDSDRIEVLTRQQFAALQGLFRYLRVAIVGPAGSGKTVLALWRLQSLVEEGRRAIYLCYNKDLARALRLRWPSLKDNIESVDRFFLRIAQAHVPTAQADLNRFFREQLPAMALDVAAMWDEESRYDAVIVDEGQDFSEDQLIAAVELVRPETGAYIFFADWRQDLYRQATSGAVGAEIVYSLHHNCRNTERVNGRTNKLVEINVSSMPGVPEGVDPIVVHCSDKSAMASRAWALAHEWSKAGGGTVILSPYTLANSCMAGAPKGHGMTLVSEIEQLGKPGTIYFSTIRSFKGIEAASVIVVDLSSPRDDPGSALRPEDLYVACTRPTARLAFLTSSIDAAKWLNGTAPVTALPLPEAAAGNKPQHV